MDPSEIAWSRSIAADAACLRSLGTLATQTGRIDQNRISLCLHSSIAPARLDKTIVSQDYGIAWVAGVGLTNGPRWVAAVADGLTSSF